MNILDMNNPMNQRDAILYCIGLIGNEVAKNGYSPISKEYGQYGIECLRQLDSEIGKKESKQEDMNAFLDTFDDFSVLATERKIWRKGDQIMLFGIYVAGVLS